MRNTPQHASGSESKNSTTAALQGFRVGLNKLQAQRTKVLNDFRKLLEIDELKQVRDEINDQAQRVTEQ